VEPFLIKRNQTVDLIVLIIRGIILILIPNRILKIIPNRNSINSDKNLINEPRIVVRQADVALINITVLAIIAINYF